MNKQDVKKLALECGFKLKEQPDGDMDLNPYVYEFAEALGIPSAKLNQFVKAYNGDLESVLGELSSTVDVLEILNEGVN